MTWRQIFDGFPWRNALLLAILSASQFLCWWSWNSFELSPLERYYLPAYYRCTVAVKHPRTRCQFVPLFETASDRKSRLVLSTDIMSGKTGDLPLQLSAIALDDGWSGLTKGPLILDDSSAVESFLREAFYQGRTFWQLAQEPLWSGAIILVVVIVVASVSFGRALVSEWRHLWTVSTGAIWSIDPEWISTKDRSLINSPIGQVSTRSKSLWESGCKFLSSALRKGKGRDVAERTLKTPKKMWIGRLVSPHLTDTVPAPQSHLKALPVDRSNVPAKPRYIFPGKDGTSLVNQPQRVWDESQWID